MAFIEVNMTFEQLVEKLAAEHANSEGDNGNAVISFTAGATHPKILETVRLEEKIRVMADVHLLFEKILAKEMAVVDGVYGASFVHDEAEKRLSSLLKDGE